MSCKTLIKRRKIRNRKKGHGKIEEEEKKVLTLVTLVRRAFRWEIRALNIDTKTSESGDEHVIIYGKI